MPTNRSAHHAPWRLIAWLVFMLLLTALNYAGQHAGDDPPDDLAYRYSTAILAVVQYGIFLAIVALIAWGTPTRETFALRRPSSWTRALGLVGAVLAVIWLTSLVYAGVLSLFTDTNPSDEQNLVPDGWDSSRAGAFVAFFVAVTFLGPIVEELMFRGLGYGLFEPYGRWTAILVTSLVFGLYHGLLVALPVLVVVGLGLAWLRARTSSIYPPMLLHIAFNGVALIASVAFL